MLKKGFVEIIEEEELERLILKNVPLNIKFGVDPTSSDIHLGHMVILRKLKEFQEQGHSIIFIIGDFTATIGDPSGRDKTRTILKEEQIKENASSYQEQVFKVLLKEKTKILYNSSWFLKMSLKEFINLSFSYTISRMLERNDFELRYKSRNPIAIAEFLYPLLQGYDSYIVKADIEIGGTDQKFNMLLGREIQRFYGLPPQVVLTIPILPGLDGKLKMSKSYNNYIGIKDSPKEMFGKIMSLSDSLMIKYYELLTDKDHLKIKKDIEDGILHPMKAKKDLAFLIVSDYHSKEEAENALLEFENVFQKKMFPCDVLEYRISKKTPLVDILYHSGITKSKSEARRLIREGAVFFNKERINSADFELEDSGEIKIGKRRFLRIVNE